MPFSCGLFISDLVHPIYRRNRIVRMYLTIILSIPTQRESLYLIRIEKLFPTWSGRDVPYAFVSCSPASDHLPLFPFHISQTPSIKRTSNVHHQVTRIQAAPAIYSLGPA